MNNRDAASNVHRPRLLDAFCGEGGAGTGYHQAEARSDGRDPLCVPLGETVGGQVTAAIVRWWRERDTRPARTTCWICEKPIKPDKAPRALCGACACSGGLGPYT